MLVLSRKVGERIQIGDDITLVVSRVVGNRVTLGIEAPSNVRIVRSELAPLETSVHGEPMPARVGLSESLGAMPGFATNAVSRCAR